MQLIKVATLRDLPVTDRQCEEFRQACIEAAGCYKAPEEAEAEVAALEQELLSERSPTITVTTQRPVEEKSIPSSAPIWNRGGCSEPNPGQPTVGALQSSQKKRGPKTDIENHTKVAGIVRVYGDRWFSEENLVAICDTLDREGVPVPKTGH